MDEVKRNPNCPCKNRDCENHGICEKCIANHKRRGDKTGCQRLFELPDGEK